LDTPASALHAKIGRSTAKSVMNLQVTIASSIVTAIKPGGGIRPGLIRLGLHERCGSPHIRERSR
jgi:hypothetical protein